MATLLAVGTSVTILGAFFTAVNQKYKRPEWWKQVSLLKAYPISNLRKSKEWVLVETKAEREFPGHLHQSAVWTRVVVKSDKKNVVLSEIEKPDWLIVGDKTAALKVAVKNVYNPSRRSTIESHNPFGKDASGVLNTQVEVTEEALLPNEPITVLGKLKKEHGKTVLRAECIWRGKAHAFQRHVDKNTHVSEKLAAPFLQYGGFFSVCLALLLSYAISF